MRTTTEDQAQPQETTDEIPVAELGTRWATDDATTVQSLVAATGTVFTAEVVALDHQEEIDLVPDDPDATPAPLPSGKPRPANDGPPPLPVSYFEVRVIEAISGDVSPGDSLLVRQMGGLHKQSTDETIRVIFEGDEPLRAGERYLFFTGDASGPYVSTSPFRRLHVESDGSYSPLDGWSGLGAMAEIASLSGAEARSAIRAAVAGEPH